MSRREWVLKAAYEAERLHRQFRSRERAEAGFGRVDIFEMVTARDLPLIFRPMRNLLGAFLREPGRGILVTTRRPLSVQRFTVAHELGHDVLGHQASIDGEDVLTRALTDAPAGQDQQEVEANAFAAHLLTPPWLVVHHMKDQGWSREDLGSPEDVYQLSLRMGSSYAATCYALREQGSITWATFEELINVAPRDIKRSLVGGYEPPNWYGDVWRVTDHDVDSVLEVSQSDLLVVQLTEHSGSGYVWEIDDLARAGLAIRRDERQGQGTKDQVGGPVQRRVVAELNVEQSLKEAVHLREIRPWQPRISLNALRFGLLASMPFEAGLLPSQRQASISAA